MLDMVGKKYRRSWCLRRKEIGKKKGSDEGRWKKEEREGGKEGGRKEGRNLGETSFHDCSPRTSGQALELLTDSKNKSHFYHL